MLMPMASDTIKNYATFNSLARIRHLKSGLFLSIADNISLDSIRKLNIAQSGKGDREEEVSLVSLPFRKERIPSSLGLTAKASEQA